MAANVLAVELRENTGKGVARKLRAKGLIPAIFYGTDQPSKPLVVEAHALDHLIASSAAGINTLIDLKGGGPLDGKVVLVKALQRDPVRGALLHADFYAVDLTRKLEVSVPIHLVGTAQGLKFGGIVDHALREIELECLPNAIPEEIPVDITAMQVGDSLHVRDIPLPAGVTLVSDPDLSVVSVALAAAEEEAAASTEVVEGEGEGEGEGEAADGAKDAAADGGEDKKGD